VNRPAHLLALCIVSLAVLAASGCVSSETGSSKMMGGVWGYVASPRHASLTVDAARSSSDGIVLSKVVAPADSFVVVSEQGTDMPMAVKSVPRGETDDVKVPLSGVTSLGVVVTLYLDRGRPGLIDFDPMNPTASTDRPIFVGGKPVASDVTLWQAGQPSQLGSATIDVADQVEASGTITIAQVSAPGPSWITVSTDASGTPGTLIGSLSTVATDTTNVRVPLTDTTYRGNVWVGLHVDAGVLGAYEYDRWGTLASSPDQLYTIAGKEVLIGAVLR
jgi:hypothetical protein